MLSSSSEDYLETILTLTEELGSVGVTNVAKRMGLSKPSVTEAVAALKEKDLVAQEKYGKITLTKAGMLEAKRIRHRHLVLKSFLRDVLGVADEQSELDACQIEHVVSSETMERIMKFMEERFIEIDSENHLKETLD
jgi:DtxR family Mn-dependent transcriptional regulator